MSFIVSAITQIGQIQIEQLIRLEQFIVIFSRNLMILLLTPLFTLSILECVAFCYRLVLRNTVGRFGVKPVATFKFKQVDSPWKFNHQWMRKLIGTREDKRE